MNTTINQVHAPQTLLQTGNNAYKKLLVKLREQIIAGNILADKHKKP